MGPQTEAYSHIEVSGDDISAVVRGISSDPLRKIILGKYDLENVEKGEYYPMDRYLSLLYEIEEKMPSVLRNIGRHVIQEAILPDGITAFDQALEVADTAYHLNHRGAGKDEIGHYRFERQPDRSLHMIVDSPYPCLFDEGVILGIADKFGAKINITHHDGTCRKTSDPHCHYSIEIVEQATW